MRSYIRFLPCLFAIVLAGAVHADKDFSSWRKHSEGRLISETEALHPGSLGTIGFYITLKDHWHTYWANPGDSGTALRIAFKNSQGLTVKQVHMPVPQRFMTGPLVSFGYSHQALFLIDVEVADSLRIGQNADFEAEVEWLVCEDVCIPAFDTVKLSLPLRALEDVKPSENFALFQKARAELPRLKSPFPHYFEKNRSVFLTVNGFEDREFVDFFPFRNSGVTNLKPEVVAKNPLALKFEKANVANENRDRVGVLVSRDSSGQLEAWQFGDSGWSFDQGGSSTEQSLWWMIVSAFMGGLILNLMPCVFPILSIKLLSLLKLSSSHVTEVRRQNFSYVAGVLASFLLIAVVLVGLRSAGTLVGWGFQLQSPVFLSLLVWLFFALALNLFGVYEIDFLNTNLGNRLTRVGGLTGSFFTGVLAVVVASPCTAPFMGVALGFGLTQSPLVLILIFLSLGFGLAFPYLLFGIFPKMIRVLPRPGRWMNVVKQIMAFPLLLTTLWLLWVLSQVRGSDSVIVVLLGCLAIGFALWLSSWRRRAAKMIAGFIIIGGVVFIYNSERKAESGLHSEIWVPFRAQMDELKGQRVFVNMTADWCLTCKVNERLVFNDPEIMALLKTKNVILVKGDWTQRNEEITRFLARYDRVGVPFYVLYSPQHPQGQVLPEVLSKSTFKELILKEFPD